MANLGDIVAVQRHIGEQKQVGMNTFQLKDRFGNVIQETRTRSLNPNIKPGVPQPAVGEPDYSYSKFSSYDLEMSVPRAGSFGKNLAKWNVVNTPDPATPVFGYEKLGRHGVDMGHLINAKLGGVGTFVQENQIPMDKDFNQSGSFYKAEMFARGIANASKGEDIEVEILPDWNNAIDVQAKVDPFGNAPYITKKMPTHVLMQIKTKHGDMAFYFPNDHEATQEPSKYIINKKDAMARFPKYADKFNKLPDEDGFKQQFATYLNSIVGNSRIENPNLGFKEAIEKFYIDNNYLTYGK